MELVGYNLYLISDFNEEDSETIDKIIFCAKSLISSDQPYNIRYGAKVLESLTSKEDDEMILKCTSGPVLLKITQHLSTYYNSFEGVEFHVRLVENICSSNNTDLIQRLLDFGLLDCLLQVLKSQETPFLIASIIYCLTNIAADYD